MDGISSGKKRLNKNALATLETDYNEERMSRVAKSITGYTKSVGSRTTSIKLTLNSLTSEKRREGKLMLIIEMIRTCNVPPQQIN